jgi:Rrf2 family nitric oxide-sensitive transcriptional repressor
VQLTLHSDYALRVLIHLAVHEGERVTAEDVARAYGISKAHLTKVVQRLARAGFVETLRGRGGGLRLARAPEAIGLGEVVRATESLELVECMAPGPSPCAITAACGLRDALGDALEAFLEVLDRHTLADATARRRALRRRLAPGPPGRVARARARERAS